MTSPSSIVTTETFENGLRDWYTSNRDQSATTAMYQAKMEEHYGAPLDWFFDRLVNVRHRLEVQQQSSVYVHVTAIELTSRRVRAEQLGKPLHVCTL